MAEHYPLPDYAVSVWVAGDHLMVAFPGQGTEKGHTVRLPISKGGLETVIKMLRERETAKDLRLSQPGTPSQWDTELILNDAKYKAWLGALANDREAKRRERAEAEEFLKELGL